MERRILLTLRSVNTVWMAPLLYDVGKRRALRQRINLGNHISNGVVDGGRT